MVIVAFSLVNFPGALLLLRGRALGLSVAGLILVYATYNASYAIVSSPAGLLSDRLPPPRVYAFGFVCFAVRYLGLGLITDRAWVWPLFVVYGGYDGRLTPARRSNLAGRGLRME